MKRIAILLTALSLAACPALRAQESNPFENIGISTAFAWESEYNFRGTSFGEETFFPQVEITYGNFYVGLWAAMPLNEIASVDVDESTETVDVALPFAGFGDEVDFYAGYGFTISDMISGDAGITIYTFPNATDSIFNNAGGPTYEPYIGFSFDTYAAPSLYFYYDIELNVFTVILSGSHSLPLTDYLSFDVAGDLGYITGAKTTGNFYGVVSGGLTATISDNASINFFVAGSYSSADGFVRNDTPSNVIESVITGSELSSALFTDSTFWYGISASLSFP